MRGTCSLSATCNASVSVILSLIAMCALQASENQTQSESAKSVLFEVVSVKPSQLKSNTFNNYKRTGGPGTADPERFACENFDLASLIEMAYDAPYYLVKLQAWMESAKFDVIAKMPPETTEEQFRLMLQAMLAERFKLVVHREVREIPVYDLVIAKGGPKLKRASTGAESKDGNKEDFSADRIKTDSEGFPSLPAGQTVMAISNDHARIQEHLETMAHFASILAGQLHEPVDDRTGLDGKYSFSLSWIPGSSDNQMGPTLFDALQEQLGLRLKRARSEESFLIIDKAEKVPTAN
jgi:uncharacterized protein (TIGR03435 family)